MSYFTEQEIHELQEKCGTFQQNAFVWFFSPGSDTGDAKYYGVDEIRYLNRQGVCDARPSKVEAVRPLTEQAYYVLLTLGGPGWPITWDGMVACGEVETNAEARAEYEKAMGERRAKFNLNGLNKDADGNPLEMGAVYQTERGHRVALVRLDYEFASATYTASGRVGDNARRVC